MNIWSWEDICEPRNVEVLRYGDLEPRRYAAGLETWRHVEGWRSGALKAYCRCCDEEVWSSGTLDARRRC